MCIAPLFCLFLNFHFLFLKISSLVHSYPAHKLYLLQVTSKDPGGPVCGFITQLSYAWFVKCVIKDRNNHRKCDSSRKLLKIRKYLAPEDVLLKSLRKMGKQKWCEKQNDHEIIYA